MKSFAGLSGLLAVESLNAAGWPTSQPSKKRKPKTPINPPHPASPEGGWPETRQQRRNRERMESKNV